MSNIVINIRKIEDLLSDYIGSDRKIVDTNISYLTSPGENYGSTMLKLNITLQSKTNLSKEELNLIAKMIPPDEYIQKIFNIQVSFKTEIGFYNCIIPTLENFKKKYNVTKGHNLFAKFYGGRINLGNSEKVDENAVIIQENLKLQEYKIMDRYQGFDLNATQLILKCLAEFHAVPLAVKLQEPELFETNIKHYCACFLPPRPIDVNPMDGTLAIINEKEKFQQVLPKIRKSFESSRIPQHFREPFSTIVHADMWVNNIMVKFNSSIPLGVKFLDFQLFTYDTPLKDLLFFLITSVPLELLKIHFDDFLNSYHEHFIENLLNFNCDVSKFSYKYFLDEIIPTIEQEIGQMLYMMLFVIYAPKDGNDAATTGIWDDPKNAPIQAKEKAWWFVEECIRRQYL